jgi:hypothetical protein
VWRWIYPVVLVGLIATAVLIADAGLDNALDISEGDVTQVETDPCKPGFLAEVDPTSTMLVIETDAKNEAVGVTAMSLGADGKGGWVLQIPLETRVKDNKLLWQFWHDAVSPAVTSSTTTRPSGSTTSTTVAPLSADATAAGKSAMARTVGEFLRFSFGDNVLVLPTRSLAALIAPALPLSMTLQTPVRAAGNNEQQIFGTGAIKVQKDTDVVQLFENIGGDPPTTRLKRQIDLLNVWIDALDATPALLDSIKSDSDKLVEYLKALATGPSQFRQLPMVEEAASNGAWVYTPNEAETRVLAAQMVPFPVMIEPGARLRTALFNGTANCDLTLSSATRFAENGAQIGVLGNAKTLDVAQSEVVYYDPELESRVRTFATALGIDAVRRIDGESAVDVTVTLGADFKG